MKSAVTFKRQYPAISIQLHAGNGFGHGVQMFAFGLRCGYGGDFAFNYAACAYQLKRSPFVGRQLSGIFGDFVVALTGTIQHIYP